MTDTFLRGVRRAPPPPHPGPGRALRPPPSAPRPPALPGVPTHPELSPKQQVGPDEGEQAAQRPLPAQELVGAAAQPQHGLPQQPGHRGGHPAGGLLHLPPRARHRPFLLRFPLLLLAGSPGGRRRRRRLLGGCGSRASLLGGLRGRRARHLRRRWRAGTGTGTRAGAPRCRADRAAGPGAGRAPRGAGGWVPCDVSPCRGGPPPGGSGCGPVRAGLGGAGRPPPAAPACERGGVPGVAGTPPGTEGA